MAQQSIQKPHQNPDEIPEGRQFSHREWRAYEAHKAAAKAGKEWAIGPQMSAQFFELFLNGKGPTAIQREFPSYPLGQIVRCAVENQWHDRREEYLQALHRGVVERAKQAASESTEFVADLLAVAHKRWGASLRRYLATGDVSCLEGFEVRSIDQYRKVISTFIELTGHAPAPTPEDGAPKASGSPVEFDLTAVLASRRLTPEQAAALLSLVSAPAEANEEKEVVMVEARR